MSESPISLRDETGVERFRGTQSPGGGSRPVVSIAAITVGTGPYALAFSPDGAKAYIVNFADATVSVIDVATGAVTNTITVGTNAQGVAFTPDGSKAYVANNGDSPGTLSIIDTATETVTGTVADVGEGPLTISISADGSTAYVVDGSDDTIAVAVVDVATDTVTDTVTHDVAGANSIAGALRPGAAEFWVVNGAGGGSVVVLNTETLAAAATIPALPNGVAIVFSPDGSLAYLADDNGIDVIDAATQTVIDTITGVVSSSEFGLAINSDGSILYFAGGLTDINVIDTATRAVTDTITVADAGFFGVAVSPDDALVYGAENSQAAVAVVDTATNTLGTVVTGPISLTIPADAVSTFIRSESGSAELTVPADDGYSITFAS